MTAPRMTEGMATKPEGRNAVTHAAVLIAAARGPAFMRDTLCGLRARPSVDTHLPELVTCKTCRKARAWENFTAAAMTRTKPEGLPEGMVAVDWSQPIEAVRKSDGKVVPMTFLSRHSDIFETVECPHSEETNRQWREDGTDWCFNRMWFVRNRAASPTPTKAATAEGQGVTQGDRDAASLYAWAEGDVGTQQLRYEIRQGQRDNHPLVEAFARHRQAAQADLVEALTPSVETKGAYSGEFFFHIAEFDEDGSEHSRKVMVPWDTIKEVMKAIRERANLAIKP